MGNSFRLRANTMFNRIDEEQKEEPLKIVFLSVEGNKTEKQYFQYVEKYREKLGIKREVHIHTLQRAKNDNLSAPENVLELLEALSQEKTLRVEIETNGSIDLTPYCNLERRPSFTMDYKMPESGMEHAMLLANMEKLSDEDTVKFVVSSRSDMERAVEIMEEYRLRERTAVPVFGKIEPVEMVDFLIEKKLNDVKLQLQLHKIIWDPQKRGV